MELGYPTQLSQNINNFLSNGWNRVQLFESKIILNFRILSKVSQKVSPLNFLLPRNIGIKASSRDAIIPKSTSLQTRIPPFFESRTCRSAFFQWKIVRARGIFPHIFTIVTDIASTKLRGGGRKDYDAIPFKDGQAIVSLAKTRETLRGIILEAFTRLRSIIGGNSTVIILSIVRWHYRLLTTDYFSIRPTNEWRVASLFFPVSPTDAIISRLLPRYINISTFVRWSRLKCMLLSPFLSLFLLNHSFE